MVRWYELVVCGLMTATTLSAPGLLFSQEAPAKLNEHLAVFEPMLGKTWKGEFASSTKEKPVFDIARWERALNGNAIRILHSVNDGVYGGESILMWDPKQEKIAAWYFTTAGFYTQSTFEVNGKTWTTIEEVTGNSNGITKVKAVTRLLANGEMQVKAEYFAKDEWKPGHEVLYKPTPGAEVKFK
jgi:hypothetical protein